MSVCFLKSTKCLKQFVIHLTNFSISRVEIGITLVTGQTYSVKYPFVRLSSLWMVILIDYLFFTFNSLDGLDYSYQIPSLLLRIQIHNESVKQ